MPKNGVRTGKRQRPSTAFLILQRNQRSADAIAAALRSRFGGGDRQVVVRTAAATGAELSDPTGSDRLRRWWDEQRTGVPLSATVVIALDDERGTTARVSGHPANGPAYEVPTGTVDELADAVAARTLTCVDGEPAAAGTGRGLAPKLLLTGALVAGGWVLSTALAPGGAAATTLPAAPHAHQHTGAHHDAGPRAHSRHTVVPGQHATAHRPRTVYLGLTHRPRPAAPARPHLTRRQLTVLPPTETTKAQFPGSERLHSHLRHQHLSVNRFGSAPRIRYPWSHALVHALQTTPPAHAVVAVPRGTTRPVLEFAPAVPAAPAGYPDEVHRHVWYPDGPGYAAPDDDYSAPSSGDTVEEVPATSGGGDAASYSGESTGASAGGISGELPRSAMPGGAPAPSTADGGSVAAGTGSVTPTLPSGDQAPAAPQAPPAAPAAPSWGVTGGGYSDALAGGKVGYYEGTDDKGVPWHEISLNPGIGTPGLLGSFVHGDGAAPAPGANLNAQAGYSVAGAGATVGTTLGMDKGHLGLSGTLSTSGPLGAGLSSNTPVLHFDGTPPGPASTSGGWVPNVTGLKNGTGFARGPLLNGVTEKPWSTSNISANAGAGFNIRWNRDGMVDAGLPGPKDLDHQILDPVGTFGLENPSVPGGTILGMAAYGGESFEHSGLPQQISGYVHDKIAAATDPSTPQGALGYTLVKGAEAVGDALSGINPAEVAMQPTGIDQLLDAGKQFATNLSNEPSIQPQTPIGNSLDYAEPGTDATNQALLDGTAPTTAPLDYAEPDTNATNQALLDQTGTINGTIADPLDYAEPDTDATNQALLDGTAPTTAPLDYAEPDTDSTNQALLDGTSADQLDYAEPDTDATNQALLDNTDANQLDYADPDTDATNQQLTEGTGGDALDYAEPDTESTNEDLLDNGDTDTGNAMDYAEPDTDATNDQLTEDSGGDALDYAEPDTDSTNEDLTDSSDTTDSGDAMDYAEPDTDTTNEDLTDDSDTTDSSDTLDYAEPDTDTTNEDLTDSSDTTDTADSSDTDSSDVGDMDSDDSSDESVTDDTDDPSDESVSDDTDDSSDESVTDDADDSGDESVSDDTDDSGSDDAVSDDADDSGSDDSVSDDADDSGSDDSVSDDADDSGSDDSVSDDADDSGSDDSVSDDADDSGSDESVSDDSGSDDSDSGASDDAGDSDD